MNAIEKKIQGNTPVGFVLYHSPTTRLQKSSVIGAIVNFVLKFYARDRRGLLINGVFTL